MVQKQASVFGSLLYQYRAAAGWTQEELAERAQISPRTVSDLERGVIVRPRVHTARQLADALELSGDERRRLLDARLTARGATATIDEAAGGSAASAGPPADASVSVGKPAPEAAVSHEGQDSWLVTARRAISPSIAARRRVPVSDRALAAVLAVLLALSGGMTVWRVAGGTAAPPVAQAGRADQLWPLPGPVPGTLLNPTGVALSTPGIVYVVDAGADCIDRFSSSGRFLGAFGAPGSRRGQLRQPRGIAVSGAERVYVSDTGNDRIEVFTPDGRWLASWGGPGRHVGRFRSPRGLAIDTAGDLYVADRDNNRIQEFSPSGAFLHAWGPGIPTGPEQHPPPALYHPLSVAVDAADNIYVADEGVRHLHEFSPIAVPLGDWGSSGSGGGLADPTAIAVEADGTVVVGQDSGTPLIEYAAFSHALLDWRLPSKRLRTAAVAPARNGALFVADAASDQVLRLDSRGAVVARLGRRLIRPDDLSAPGSLATDVAGDLYVADAGHRRTVELDLEGRPLAQWDRGAMKRASGLAVDRKTDDLYVTDAARGRVDRYAASGKLLASWGGFGDPRGIAIDAGGNVYVTDDTAGTLQKFTPSGTRDAAWTIAPPDITNGIGAVAIGGHGRSYVAVPGQGLVLVISATGETIARFPGFHGPIALAGDGQGNVYVADAGRLQEFSPAGRVLRSAKLTGASGVGSFVPAGLAVDARFDVFLSDAGAGRILRLSPRGWG